MERKRKVNVREGEIEEEGEGREGKWKGGCIGALGGGGVVGIVEG